MFHESVFLYTDAGIGGQVDVEVEHFPNDTSVKIIFQVKVVLHYM